MHSRLAMMTIEVLIALVIIFMTIVMSASTVKYFNMTFQKKAQYIDIYTTVLSIKDKVEDDICITNSRIEGMLNGFNYTVECHLLTKSPSFSYAADDTEESGLFGTYMIKLNEVKLSIKKKHIKKEFKYYLTKAKKR